MWKFGQAVNIGKRSEQQDRIGMFHSKNGKRHLMVVADGMGGLKKGAQAAQIVIETAQASFSKHRITNPESFLENICFQAHESIKELDSDVSTAPGTTCVLLFIDNNKAFWLHVGDSRLYHFRKGQIINQTTDHSVRQLMISKGLVEETSDAAMSLQNQLYNRLGGEKVPEPDINSSIIEKKDMFLLCSDGLWQSTANEQIMKILEDYPIDQDGPEQLVNIARQNGGHDCDNISLTLGQNITPPKKTIFEFWRQNT